MTTPKTALLFGGILSYFFYFVPVGLVFHFATKKNENSCFWATVFFSLFLLLSQLYFPSESSWSGVHVDPVAFGFVTLAGAMLCVSETRIFHLILSSLFVSLAVWTKQTFFPALFAFCFCTYLTGGTKKFLKHVVIQFSVFLFVTGIFATQYSWDVLLFNTVYYPSSFPWRASLFDSGRGYIPTSDHFGILKSFISFGYELYGFLAPHWAIVLLVFCVLRFTNARLRLKELFSLNLPFTHFFILSLCLIPTSILGRVKFGGAENCLNPSLCYTLLATLLLFYGILSSREANTKGYSQMVSALAFSFLLFGAGMKFPDLYSRMQAATRLSVELPPQDRAFEIAKKYPHQVYFPWYPLSTLMSEGKFYHYAIGVGDRNMSAFPVGQEHFMRHLPSELKWIAFFDQDHNILARLKDFEEEVKLPDFPGFTVFQRKQTN